MIEATCAACGTVNRIAEADVPPGAKFVSCASCKSKVAVTARPPAVPMPGKPLVPGPAKNVAIPAVPKLPTPPKGAPAVPRKPAGAELADVPAPGRQSPLAGVPSLPKPPSRSALAAAELPVPKIGAKATPPPSATIDLDDLMPPAETASAGLADLPASKPRTSPLVDLPAPKPAPKSALADLPAPKPAPKSALADLPAPKTRTQTNVPKPPLGITDLPAPKGPVEISDLPAPKGPVGITDLPAPKGPVGITDLPAPKGPVGITDLPAPKGPVGITDLPAPKGPLGLTDLPMPKGPAGGTLELEEELDLPMPKPELPAPKGFFDDLPQPVKSAPTQDIAPKGFFDDLPQPVKSAPTQDIAPKGFFDDLPQPAKSPTMDLAPSGGLFDDLPQPAKSPTMDLAPSGGLFDDLPNPTKSAATPDSSVNLFDDLAPPAGKGAADMALGVGDIDLGPAASGPGLELDSGPALDLDGGGGGGGGLPDLAPSGPLGEDSAFQDLDLSPPTAGKAAPPADDASPIKIKTPGKGAAAKTPISINVPSKSAPADVKLDLADDPHDQRGPAPAQKSTPKTKAAEVVESPEARAAKRKRSRILLGSLLGVVALGAGGFFFYQRHAAAKAQADEIASQLATAEQALKAADANHWTRARNAADEAIKLDGTNTRAIGIAAEATIAGALDTGVNKDARIAQARAMLQDALGAGRTSAELERAQAVAAIAAKGQAQRAVDLLKVQIGKNPKDGWLHLYMGWAQLAKGDAAEAIKAFDQAIALAPPAKIPALYGQGQAKLLVADVDGAKASFEAILQLAKDHVCAQVGLIAAMPPSQSVQQVAELEAVLQRKDIGTADPRCRVQAHTLIGDVHRTAGRLDMARQRYRDALKLVPLDVPTHDGLAAVELREGKLTLAADHIQKALAANSDHAETLLLQADLYVREGKLNDAESLIEKLAARTPPLATLSQAQLFVVRGRLLEAKGQADAAVDAYVEGAKLAGELDLTATMAAVTKLTELAQKAADPAKAAAYRARAADLLAKPAERALEDAQLSTAIGIAYLHAGDATKAETFLERAVALKGDDVEAKLQLAKVKNVLGKPDAAIAQLKEAQGLDGKRTDVALELAKTYQRANRHDEAVAAYDKLLALDDVESVVRINAGRYFAKRGMYERAAAQAEPVLAAEPDNPGGLYLKAEGLIQAKKPEEAAPLLIKATDVDPEAQYLDALGRALEGRIKTDTKYIEGARAAYERAAKADPTMFHPWLGQGRMLVARKDWDPAIKPLLEANKLDKGNSEAMYYLGNAYFGLRVKPEARKVSTQWLEAALKGRPALELELRAEASYMLGELYDDLDRGRDAARSWEIATELGVEIEKQTGKSPPWLTETYYELGDLYDKMANYPAEKRAYERYIARSPKPGPRLINANNALATKLKQY